MEQLKKIAIKREKYLSLFYVAHKASQYLRIYLFIYFPTIINMQLENSTPHIFKYLVKKYGKHCTDNHF